MPWHVGTSTDCPSGKPYAVIKDATGEVEGCHETEEKAKAQMAALYANETTKAEWDSSYITALPDSAFACVDSKGRHYPHHNAKGKLDMPHLRNAMSRLGQDDTTSCGAEHLRAHARAMGMGEKTVNYLKAEQLKGNKWRVLAIPFGGPFEGKDLDGEFFSANTDIKPDWFDRRPLVWHHNQDQTLKADPVIGTADDLEETEEGWWTTVWMDRSHRYFDQIAALLAANKVYGSSGSLPNFVKVDKRTGEILIWPYIEQTFTPTPSNIFSRVVAAKAIDHFAEARIGLPPAVRDIFSDLDTSTADLPSDLAPAGDEAAIQRLTGAITHLEELLKQLRR